MSKLINADELKSKFLEMGCMDDEPCYGAEIIDRMPTVKAIPIPDNATNGDVIQAAFPRAETWIDEYDHLMRFDLPENETLQGFNLDWWNMSYKGE